MKRAFFVIGALVIGISAQAQAQAPAENPFGGAADGPSRFSQAAEHISLRVISSHSQVTPGQSFHVAVEMRIADGWHYYSVDPNSTPELPVRGAKLEIDAGGLAAGAILWPPGRPYDSGVAGIVNNIYEGRAIAFIPLTVPDKAALGEVAVAVTASGQLCAEVCLDMRITAGTEVTVGETSVANPAWDDDVVAALALASPPAQVGTARSGAAGPTSLSVWGGLGLALLAGLILNVMPCVLPVIPIRILTIIQQARQSRKRFVVHGLAFAGGIMLFFVGLAGVNVVLRLAVQRTFAWGRQFQSTGFRVAVAMLMVALAANLFGLFNVLVPRKLLSADSGEAGRRAGYLSTAGMGLMMAIIATPCSFAILAAAMAWAQTQTLLLGTVALLSIGVGMAAPHVMLTALPDLVNKLPRPGRWMELLKQSMGFALLLVAIWLIGTLCERMYAAWVSAYGVVLTFALWMWGSWVRYDAPVKRKLAVRGLAVVLAASAGFWMLREPRPPATDFQPFDQVRIDAAGMEGRTVLIKFTASWCLSCKWVDTAIYDDREIADELERRGVLVIRGDVTTENLPANRMLYEELRGAPPLTVVLPPGGAPPIRLEGKFSKQDLLDALDKARKK